MVLRYKIEMLQFKEEADDSAFVHLRSDVPAFRTRIGKEAYRQLDVTEKNSFITGLFALRGITEISSTAFRVWVMKAPSFAWEEVLPPLLEYLKDQIGEDELEALPGSAKLDGKGLRLESEDNRRQV